jgi:hypothetical protein
MGRHRRQCRRLGEAVSNSFLIGVETVTSSRLRQADVNIDIGGGGGAQKRWLASANSNRNYQFIWKALRGQKSRRCVLKVGSNGAKRKAARLVNQNRRGVIILICSYNYKRQRAMNFCCSLALNRWERRCSSRRQKSIRQAKNKRRGCQSKIFLPSGEYGVARDGIDKKMWKSVGKPFNKRL